MKTKKILRPFNLKEYLANPDVKIRTRDGKSARIVYTNKLGIRFVDEAPIVALIEQVVHYYEIDGRYFNSDCDTSYDLMFEEEEEEEPFKDGDLILYRNNFNDPWCVGFYFGEYISHGKINGKNILTSQVGEIIPFDSLNK